MTSDKLFSGFQWNGFDIKNRPDWVDGLRAGKALAPYDSEAANVAYGEAPLP